MYKGREARSSLLLNIIMHDWDQDKTLYNSNLLAIVLTNY